MSGYSVFVESKPWRQDVDVFIGIRLGRQSRWAVGVEQSQDGPAIKWETREGDGGRDAPMFLTLPREVWEAIGKAAAADELPDDATADALRDARVTRDRLLTIIEKTYEVAA